MAFAASISGWYHDNVVLGGDPRTKGWLMVDSPIPVFAILGAYYLFVRRVGPWLMRGRKPMKLRSVMQAYNAMQVAVCLTFMYHVKEMPLKENWMCMEVLTDDPVRNFKMASMGWFYYMIKYVDLIDTVFFVLCKKQSHITFLHLFHHISVVMVWWAFMKYVSSGAHAIVPLFNTLVHLFMYTYYLAVLCYGKINLFWKKLMTKIQLAQFLLGTTILIINLVNPHCGFPKLLLVPLILHGFAFIYLFSRFYYTAYIRNAHKLKTG